MCNNSPAEWISPENGWRSSGRPILDLQRETYDALKSRRAWSFVIKPLSVSLGETDSSADLGGSSKYSNENFED